MNNSIEIKKTENYKELLEFLKKIDNEFPIPLSKKVNLEEYAKKTIEYGTNFFAIKDKKIIGTCLGYINDKKEKKAYISVLGILPEYRNMRIGHSLITTFKKYSKSNNMKSITLFVHRENERAIKFYENNGFRLTDEPANADYSCTMKLELNESTNILLTSVGRRGYLVNYFKEAIGNNGKVYVSNSNDLSPAFNYADKSVVTPLIYDETYIDFLTKYCIENDITAIISLFDVDLPILAKNKKKFEELGIRIIVSDIETIEVCNDKWKTYNFLKENGFNTVNTYIQLKDAIRDLRQKKINYPVIIKPRWGMGSISVMEAENEEELHVLYNKAINTITNTYLKYESISNINEAVIVQEKIKGKEHGLDIINNLNGEYQTTIVKEKLAMRSGETDCAKVIQSDILKKLGKSISKKLKHIGNMDVDVFMVEDKPYILEMNARFGGGYPFSHLSGVNLPKAIIAWIKNKEVDSELLKEKRINVLFHKDINIIELKRKSDNNE